MRSSVLVLEDDPLIRELLGIVLGEDGHDVRFCESPEQVVRFGAESSRCLAVADFWGRSHAELVDDERAEVFRLAQTVPLILVTGREWARNYPSPDDLGVLAIVPKPFSVVDLTGMVATWMARL